MKGYTYNTYGVTTTHGDGIFTPRSQQSTLICFYLREDAPEELRTRYNFDADTIPESHFSEELTVLDAVNIILGAGIWLFASADLHKLKGYLETTCHSDEIGRLETLINNLKHRLSSAEQEFEYIKSNQAVE